MKYIAENNWTNLLAASKGLLKCPRRNSFLLGLSKTVRKKLVQKIYFTPINISPKNIFSKKILGLNKIRSTKIIKLICQKGNYQTLKRKAN